jgi:hypothetical protein
VSALYEPLIGRDLDAIPAAVQAFLGTHSPEELWIAIARFAILAYVPSQHSKRTVMAVRAAGELRDAMGTRWPDLLVECARYAAESRQPWSEPPLLDPPDADPSPSLGANDLRQAIETKDRARAERWLAACADRADAALRAVARGDALLLTDAVLALAPFLGEKGRYTLLRIAIWEMLADNTDEPIAESLEVLIAEVIANKGSLDSVRRVLLWSAGHRPAVPPAPARPLEVRPIEVRPLTPYRLARDYAQTLLAHAVYLPQRADREGFLAAVQGNLERGDGYEEWTLA